MKLTDMFYYLIVKPFVTVLSAIYLSFSMLTTRPKLKEIVSQVFYLGVGSVSIILISGVFIGLVLSLQGYYTLSKFGANSVLGTMVSLSVLRELGPVVTAMLFAGRAGSSMTSEIGLMKATDQIKSLQMMGVNPTSYILSTRMWANVISVPVLAMIFCAASIIASYVLSVNVLGLSYGEFWGNIQHTVSISDVFNGFLKGLVFAFIVAWISLYQGYSCIPNSLGIARATTKSVVYACISILVADLALTYLMFGGL